MTWVHKSVDVRSDVWRKLRINAEMSEVPVRDFLAYLIERSEPVTDDDLEANAILGRVAKANREAQQTGNADSEAAAKNDLIGRNDADCNVPDRLATV